MFISCVPCIAGRFFTTEPLGKPSKREERENMLCQSRKPSWDLLMKDKRVIDCLLDMRTRASERAAAPLGTRRRRLRGDRFGVPLPSLSGGKEVPRRETAHAPPVGGFLAV